MTRPSHALAAPGAFRADQIRPGDPYELSRGHAIFCAPSGTASGAANLLGGAVLASDPAVEEAGVDVGFSPEPGTLRAPDVAVGYRADRPGWASGTPPLALEYAGVGQDEPELQEKIRDLLGAGTRFIWVVRLVRPTRVDVYEAGAAMRTALPGETLEAPGVLRNPVPVEALYQREAAQKVTLRNLLQRFGYDGLDAVRAEGREEGREAGREEGRDEGRDQGRQALRQAISEICGVLGVPMDPDREASLAPLDLGELRDLLVTILRDRAWPSPSATGTEAQPR